MKTIAFVCLIGIGFLATANIYANPHTTTAAKRIINCSLEGDILSASSSENDGELKEIRVYRYPSMEFVADQGCSGFYCTMSVSGFASGQYMAEIDCGTTTTPFYFSR